LEESRFEPGGAFELGQNFGPNARTVAAEIRGRNRLRSHLTGAHGEENSLARDWIHQPRRVAHEQPVWPVKCGGPKSIGAE
jgi:hypothetical protein